jgi:ABC-2 type transport system permease protein
MWWEVLLGIGSQLITMVILAWISSKIYRLGVLMYGKPPKFREIIAMLKRDREQKNAVRAS